MALNNQQHLEFINRVGFEAFQFIVQKAEKLGPMSFEDIFGLVLGASAVCAASAVGPVLEQAPSAESADALAREVSRQVRELLESSLTQRDV